MKYFPIAGLPMLRFLLLLGCLAGGAALPAQSLSVQGIIKKADGTAIADGDYNLTFTFYDALSGGSQVGSPVTVNSVDVTGGVYSVVLSNLSLPFDEDYFVSVKVGSGQEMTPRIALTSAPYALALRGTANLFGSTGNVGIGTTTPSEKLHVKSTTGDTKMLLEGTAGGITEMNIKKSGFSGSGFLGYNGSDNFRVGHFGGNLQIVTINSGNITLAPANAGLVTLDGSLLVNKNVVARGGAPGSSGANQNGYAFAGNGGDNDSGLYSTADGVVSLYSNSVERLKVQGERVDVVGGVYARGGEPGGFGANHNGYAFDGAVGDDDSGMFSLGTNSVSLFADATEKVRLTSGDVYMYNLQSGGAGLNVAVTADGKLFRVASSARYKQNIQPLVADFHRLLQIEPRTYQYKTAPEKQEIGFIAEELDSLGLQPFVVYDQQGRPDGVLYDRLVVYMAPLLKEQHQRLTALEQEKAATAATLSTLQADLAATQAANAALRQALNELRADVNGLKAGAATGAQK